MKNRTFYIIMLFGSLLTLKLSAQEYKDSKDYLDSLHIIINKTKPEESIDEILKIAAFYSEEGNRNIDSSRHYANKALEISLKLNKREEELEARVRLARLKVIEGKYDSALLELESNLKIAEERGYKRQIYQAYDGLSLLYNRNREFRKAVIYGEKAYKLSIEQQEPVEPQLRLALNLVHLHYELGEFEKALKILNKISLQINNPLVPNELKGKYYASFGHLEWSHREYREAINFHNKAYDLLRKDGKILNMSTALGNIAYNYYELKEYEQAREYYLKSIALIESSNYLRQLIFNYYGVADCSKALGDFDLAIEYYQKAVGIGEQMKDLEQMGNTQKKVGFLYKQLDKKTKARKILETAKLNLHKAITIYNVRQNRTKIRDAYHGLYQIDTTFQDYKGALDNYSSYIVYKDSIGKENDLKTIKNLESAYEITEKDQEISLLKSEAEVQELKSERRASYFIGLCIGIGALLTLLLVLYRSYSQKQKLNRVLNEKYEENKLLMKEIHHRVKNNLQIILSLLNAQANSTGSDEKLKMALKESQTKIKSMAIIHQNLYKSNTFAKVKVNTYFEELMEQVKNTFDSTDRVIHFETEVENKEINISLAVPLGLIINELVTNSYKYAFKNNVATNKIMIQFEGTDKPNIYKLKIQDNGIGLPEDFDIDKLKSFGMQLVKGLVDQLHGTIKISREEGTNYEIYVEEPKAA
ncbi:histidine kinase dimerization/phosphoacceptor domain -containing protein [uncultured Croceitalea sp.]|uniref:histidine kinase dimerization/phosphoacceptor domain -containing protein n=1 Tax=uncultured Croceitalea sp. TaxID=1798908 RepID=UPI00374F2CCA